MMHSLFAFAEEIFDPIKSISGGSEKSQISWPLTFQMTNPGLLFSEAAPPLFLYCLIVGPKPIFPPEKPTTSEMENETEAKLKRGSRDRLTLAKMWIFKRRAF